LREDLKSDDLGQGVKVENRHKFRFRLTTMYMLYPACVFTKNDFFERY